MTTDRQIAANRRNAKASPGPKTARGKAAVVLNATKHGLLTQATLLASESEAEFLAFAKAMRAQLAPVGELELLLADRVISCAWRLRRALKAEAALMVGKQDALTLPIKRDHADPFRSYEGGYLERIMRYEAAIERALLRALRL